MSNRELSSSLAVLMIGLLDRMIYKQPACMGKRVLSYIRLYARLLCALGGIWLSIGSHSVRIDLRIPRGIRSLRRTLEFCKLAEVLRFLIQR